MFDLRVLARATVAAVALMLCAGACAQAAPQSSVPRADGPMPSQPARPQANPLRSGAPQSNPLDSNPRQDCPPPPSESFRPPVYPHEMKGKPPPLPLMLVLSLDHCGRVTEVQVEKSTGLLVFDRSGIDAAKTWRLDPEIKDGKSVPSRVRVPIHFESDADGAGSAPSDADTNLEMENLPSIEVMHARWQRMQVRKAPLDADGTMPGYLPDPEPMQGGFEENLSQLKRERRVDSQRDDIDHYVSDDIFDPSEWYVYEKGFLFSPAIERRRLVSDGEKTFWVTSLVCGARAPDGDCTKLEEWLRASAKPQTPVPPPPPPPGWVGGKR